MQGLKFHFADKRKENKAMNKKTHPIMIVVLLILTAAVSLLGLILLPHIRNIGNNKAALPQNIEYCGKNYSARDFIVGCIMYNMTILSEPPTEKQQEGINCAACCIKNSVIYLNSKAQLSRKSFPALYFMDCTAASLYFGGDYPYYLEPAEKAADYALSQPDECRFLPVCPLSSGLLIAPENIGDMPCIKKLYCGKDKYNSFYEGECQLTEIGIAEKLLSAFPTLIIPPVEKSMITDIKTDENGNVLSLKCCNINMSGYQFIRLFDIPSVNFKMSRSQNLYSFKTKGIGDSTGMSFYSALMLAESGMGAEEIMGIFFE
jgi:hypothetical protein